jgi:hypothetical protein
MTDNEYIEMAKEKLKGAKAEDFEGIFKSLPDGEKIHQEVRFEKESTSFNYTQKARAILAIMHGIDVKDQLEEMAIEEIRSKT